MIDSSKLLIAKVCSMVILGVSALICSVFPIVLTKILQKKQTTGSRKGLELFLRFGGGILLATTFLHLLPEVREGIEKLGSLQDSWPVQIPELVMCVGFFIMYCIEEGTHIMMHTHHHDGSEKKEHSHVVEGPPVRGLLIIVALSIHQIFEGLAIGLETQAQHVWVLLGAVAAHKLVIAVCVGAEIASSTLTIFRAALCVAVFAIASPIGIGIGVGLESIRKGDDDPTLNTVSVVLQGLATGTLMYVVFFEVLIKSEGGSKYQGILYCVATFVGFVVMLILLIFCDS